MDRVHGSKFVCTWSWLGFCVSADTSEQVERLSTQLLSSGTKSAQKQAYVHRAGCALLCNSATNDEGDTILGVFILLSSLNTTRISTQLSILLCWYWSCCVKVIWWCILWYFQIWEAKSDKNQSPSSKREKLCHINIERGKKKHVRCRQTSIMYNHAASPAFTSSRPG